MKLLNASKLLSVYLYSASAAPLKKKRKIDPAIVKLQVERRKRRLEKQIKKAQRFGRKLKPIDEMEVHRLVAKNAPYVSSAK